MSTAVSKRFRKRGDSTDEEVGANSISGSKRPRVNTVPVGTSPVAGTAAPLLGAVASTREAAPHAYGGGACAATELDTASDRDAQAQLERRLAGREAAAAAAAAALTGGVRTYTGKVGYASFVGGERDADEAVRAAKASGTAGPLRAPAGHVRGISRMDYAPDICKDYRDTGFCSFGDSCKFLHDRSEHKGSWQVEKEWAAGQKAAAEALRRKVFGLSSAPAPGGGSAESGHTASASTASTVDSGLPFACFICRGPFAEPVVTKCGHYFCGACAVRRFADDASCAACGKQTLGVFNAVSAKKLPSAAAAANALAAAAPGKAMSEGADASAAGSAAQAEDDAGGWS